LRRGEEVGVMGEVEGDEEYLLIFNDRSLKERYAARWADRPRLRCRLVPWGIYDPRSQLGLPRWLGKEGADLYHSTNYFIPLAPSPVPMIATVHDLIPLRFPYFTPRALKTRFNFVFRWVLRRCVRRAARIVAVSETTAADIRAFLGVEAARIEVIHNGIDPAYRPLPRPEAAALLPPGVDASEPFVLYVGRFDPYKNVAGLVREFASFSAAAATARLVLAGHPDPRYPEAIDEISRQGLAGRVTVVDGADEAQLIALYNLARVVALPSLYEGFGLPPLEAMACGTPVIVSDRGSLPEVVGSAGMVVDPGTAGALAGALRRVWDEPALREELSARGRRRAAEFSWAATARSTREMYRALLEGGR
ncbi:MAG TPA: glycosyltransferase family 1 protein, partial [bacterium]|nr:glycosyltransferase family 1 protein [bacterium]